MRTWAAATIALFLAGSAAAAGPISVHGAWTRPGPAGGNGAGYLVIENRGPAADALLSAASPAAASVSLHESRMTGEVMSMRALPDLRVPARGTARLAPGGYHLMFLALKRALAMGDKVPATLIFARAGPVKILLEVRASPPP